MPGRRDNTDELDPTSLNAAQVPLRTTSPTPGPSGSVPLETAAAPARPALSEPAPDRSRTGAAPEPDALGVAPDFSDDNVLVDKHEDRWHWRRKIRSNPHQLRIYRCVVAIGGLLFVVLGLITGPIPGPGGIPLILLGIAVWASEFEWAHRLMYWFKAQLHRFQSWSRLQQTFFWLAFFAFCGLCGYTFMLATGVPGWVPDTADDLLQKLPGL